MINRIKKKKSTVFFSFPIHSSFCTRPFKNCFFPSIYFPPLILNFLFNISVYAPFHCIIDSFPFLQIFFDFFFEILKRNSKNKVQLSQLYAIHHTLHMVQHQTLQKRKETKTEVNNFLHPEAIWRLPYLLHKVCRTVFPDTSNVLAAYTKHFIFGAGRQQGSLTHSLLCSWVLCF